MTGLTGKVALITGAARGIGKASAEKLAGDGASVFLTDILDGELDAAVAAITKAGGKAAGCHHDVTSEEDWEKVCAEVETTFGGLDILVNNAGVAPTGQPLDETPFDEWRQVMAINMDGVFLGLKHGIRTIKKRGGGGSIINVSSIMGIVGNANYGAYNASKGGVRLLTKTAALECAQSGSGIRVNSIHPGYVETPLVKEGMERAAEQEGAGSAEEMLGLLTLMHPIGRLGRPEEIADAIYYLASDASSFMTGSELVIDGGYTAQ